MAELGFEVLGMDVDETKVSALSEGRIPFYEPGLEPLLRKHVETGRLRFTSSYEEVAAFGDVHFVCVNTPQKHGEYACDMSFVDSIDSAIASDGYNESCPPDDPLDARRGGEHDRHEEPRHRGQPVGQLRDRGRRPAVPQHPAPAVHGDALVHHRAHPVHGRIAADAGHAKFLKITEVFG